MLAGAVYLVNRSVRGEEGSECPIGIKLRTVVCKRLETRGV